MVKQSLTFFLLSCVFSSCIDTGLLKFELDNSSTVTIKSSTETAVGTLISSTTGTSVSKSTTFAKEGTKVELVKEVFLTECTLTVTDPSSKSIDFLRWIEVYISFSDGSNKKLLAKADSIPQRFSGSTAILDVERIELDQYIKAESFSLTIEAEFNEALLHNVDLRIDQVFNVTADPL